VASRIFYGCLSEIEEGIQKVKVLVVGGSGFIGSHVIMELLSCGHDVANFSTHPITEVTWLCSRDKKGSYQYVAGSMMDQAKVSDFICSWEPQVVFNFAAISDIADCDKRPFDALRKNVLGNQYILQSIADLIEIQKAFIEKVIPKFVFASSVYVYNDKAGPYGISKRNCEEWTRYYSRKFGFPHIILRYGTIYGSGAKGNNSIKKIIDHALETKVISYYGTGEEVREYIHVSDVARCSVELLDKVEFENSAVVLTGVCPVKSKDLVGTLKDILGEEYSIEFRGETCSDHYEVTPYVFQPEIVKKYISSRYYDLGAGLLDAVKASHDDQGAVS